MSLFQIIIAIVCLIYAILSAFGTWVPNRFGTTMLWLMLAMFWFEGRFN